MTVPGWKPRPPIIAGATKTVSISEGELDENCIAFDDLRRCRELRIGKSVSPLPRFGSDTVGWIFTYQLRDGPRLCGSGRAGAGHDTGSSRGDDSRARMESKEVPCEEVAPVACCRRAKLSAGLRPQVGDRLDLFGCPENYTTRLFQVFIDQGGG